MRATISLPVPVSPVMSTVASLGATLSMLRRSARDAASSNTYGGARRWEAFDIATDTSAVLVHYARHRQRTNPGPGSSHWPSKD